MVNKLLVLLTFFLLVECQAYDCVKHPSYCQIRKNAPHLNKKAALKLSNEIHRVCIKYDVPKRVYTAILAQESMYNYQAIAKVRGLNSEGEIVTAHTDFGIAQIHYKSVERYNFNVDKLTSDLIYSLEAGAKVLAWFYKRYGKREKFWWLRFNCGTARIDRQTCKNYLRKVSRFL